MNKNCADNTNNYSMAYFDYKAIFDNSAAGIAQVSLDGKFLKVNRYFCKITGYSEKELKNLSFADITHPDDIEKDLEYVNSLAAGKIKSYSMHKRYIKKNKKHVWINLTGSLVLNKDKSPAFFVAVIEDITEYKKKEIELFESEERYRDLVELSPLAIAVHRKGFFQYMNAACLALFKAERIDKIKGLRLTDFVTRNDRKKVSSSMNYSDKDMKRGPLLETKIINFSGEEISVQIAESKIFFQGKSATIVIFNDITEKKHHEAEQKILIDKLTDKNEELERIVYISSHDMRSPLINIEGWSKHLAEQFTAVADFFQNGNIKNQIDSDLEEIINKEIPLGLNYINLSVAKMAGLLNGLLDVSRTGQVTMRVQRLDMNDLMAKVIDSMKYQINTSGVKVSVTNLHSCCGDANMINQIFTNLIDNSIKYKSEERSLRITIKSRVSEGYAVYTVRDNGKGIPENKFSSIFDLFNKIDPYSEGLGLGLSIVRKMVNRHGGDIFVSSREGVFTKFSIKLPLSGESIKSGGTDE